MSPLDYQLLIAEIRKMRKELETQLDGLRQSFAEPASTTPSPPLDQLPSPYHDESTSSFTSVTPVLVPPSALEQWGAANELRVSSLEQSGATQLVVADNWGGFFDGGDDSDEQHYEAPVVADNWGGLFEQPAHDMEERDLPDLSASHVFGSDQIHDEHGLPSTNSDASAVYSTCYSVSVTPAPAPVETSPAQCPIQIQELEGEEPPPRTPVSEQFVSIGLDAACDFHTAEDRSIDLAVLPRVDRLSLLPDVLLHDIISRLPVKDAARTAVLSRRWRPLCAAPSVSLVCSNPIFPMLFSKDDGVCADELFRLTTKDGKLSIERGKICDCEFVAGDLSTPRLPRLRQPRRAALLRRLWCRRLRRLLILGRRPRLRARPRHRRRPPRARDRFLRRRLRHRPGRHRRERLPGVRADLRYQALPRLDRAAFAKLVIRSCAPHLDPGGRQLCLFTDLLGDTLCRVRRSPASLRLDPWRRRPLRRLVWRPPWRVTSRGWRPGQHGHRTRSCSSCPKLIFLDTIRSGDEDEYRKLGSFAFKAPGVLATDCTGFNYSAISSPTRLQAPLMSTVNMELTLDATASVPVLFGRSSAVAVEQSWLLSSSAWIVQQPWPPPHVQLEFEFGSVAIRPSPWPSFFLRNHGAMGSGVSSESPWPLQPRQGIRCVLATALLRFQTCIMVISISIVACGLILELAQRKCGENCWCFLLGGSQLKDIGENSECLVLSGVQLQSEIQRINGVQVYSVHLSFLHCYASVLTLGLGTSESLGKIRFDHGDDFSFLMALVLQRHYALQCSTWVQSTSLTLHICLATDELCVLPLPWSPGHLLRFKCAIIHLWYLTVPWSVFGKKLQAPLFTHCFRMQLKHTTPPEELRLKASDAELEPAPWPLDTLVERCSVRYHSNRLWQPLWHVPVHQEIGNLQTVDFGRSWQYRASTSVIPSLLVVLLQSFSYQIAFHSGWCSRLDLPNMSSSFHWDPGGTQLLHWLGGKPKLKKGGMTIYALVLLLLRI